MSKDRKYKLTRKRRAFLRRVFRHPEESATESYLSVFTRSKSRGAAAVEAHRILSLPNAKAFLESLAEESGLQAKLTSEAVVRELRYIGFSDVSQLFDENDQLLPITALPENVTRAIKYFKMEIRKSGKGDDREVYRVVSVRLWNKLRGLQLLGKWLSMFSGKLQTETEDQIRKRVYAEIRADGEEAVSLLVANYRRLKKISAQGGYKGGRRHNGEDQA